MNPSYHMTADSLGREAEQRSRDVREGSNGLSFPT
jgi:hypothetical protein